MEKPRVFDFDQPTRETLAGIYVEASAPAKGVDTGAVGQSAPPAALFGLTLAVVDSAHEAIHLALLVDRLLDDYTRGWTRNFAAAFDDFKAEGLQAKKTRHDDTPSKYWINYSQLTRVNTDRADTILRRHPFFGEWMYGVLKPKLKDPTRIFGALERELIYYRDKKKCQVCDAEVAWADHEIHHVDEHSKGERPSLPMALWSTSTVTQRALKRPPNLRASGRKSGTFLDSDRPPTARRPRPLGQLEDGHKEPCLTPAEDRVRRDIPGASD